jgi:hypothetical protein
VLSSPFVAAPEIKTLEVATARGATRMFDEAPRFDAHRNVANCPILRE